MSDYLSLLIEHPTPLDAESCALTNAFASTFEERVLLRIVPLLESLPAQPIGLVMSATTVEHLSRIDWLEVAERASQLLEHPNFAFRARLATSLNIIKTHEGSILDYYSTLVANNQLALVARPFEAVDLACWVSMPAIVNFTFQAIQAVFEAYIGHRPSQISLLSCGYSPNVDGVLNDAGFNIVYVDEAAYGGAQSKLEFGIHRPVLNPANGIARCAVSHSIALDAASASEKQRAFWRHTSISAVIREIDFDLSQECIPSADGSSRPYFEADAVESARAHGGAHFDRLRHRLKRRGLWQSTSMSVVLLPDTNGFWCEEIDACRSFVTTACQHGMTVGLPTTFLHRFPTQAAAWLGAVVAQEQDLLSQVWLPRRLGSLYEAFRRVHQGEPTGVSLETLEHVARMILFAQMSMRVFVNQPKSTPLAGLTPASLLDEAQQFLAFSQGSNPPSNHETTFSQFAWAAKASLVRAAYSE